LRVSYGDYGKSLTIFIVGAEGVCLIVGFY
jgi:hypothetical protein